MEEDALKQSRNFWGHAYWMSYNGAGQYGRGFQSGGYTFDRYLFIAQYADGSSNKKIDPLGIFAHEFSHVLGLKDHYAKDGNGQMIVGPDKYDVMSQGMYNGTSSNAANIPAAYSAFEREAVGWLTLTEASADSVYSLKKLSDMQAYSVTNPNKSDEYYIVGNRAFGSLCQCLCFGPGSRGLHVGLLFGGRDNCLGFLARRRQDLRFRRFRLLDPLGIDFIQNSLKFFRHKNTPCCSSSPKAAQALLFKIYNIIIYHILKRSQAERISH